MQGAGAALRTGSALHGGCPTALPGRGRPVVEGRLDPSRGEGAPVWVAGLPWIERASGGCRSPWETVTVGGGRVNFSAVLTVPLLAGIMTTTAEAPTAEAKDAWDAQDRASPEV